MKNGLPLIILIISLVFTSCEERTSFSNTINSDIKQINKLTDSKVLLSSEMFIEALSDSGSFLVLDPFELIKIDTALILKVINDSHSLSKNDSDKLDQQSDSIHQMVKLTSNPKNWNIVEESEVYRIVDEQNIVYKFGFVTLIPKKIIYDFTHYDDTTTVLTVFSGSLKNVYYIPKEISDSLQKDRSEEEDNGCVIPWLKCLEAVRIEFAKCVADINTQTLACMARRQCGVVSCFYHYKVCLIENYDEHHDLSFIHAACALCHLLGISCP